MASTSKKPVPFSLAKLFAKSIPFMFNPSLVLSLGLTLVFSLFAFAGFSAFMLLAVFLLFFFSAATHIMGVAFFALILGISAWVVGIIAINTFVSGVQYHLGMQAVTGKHLDINLAWKLSAARFRDAFVVQGSMIGIAVALVVVSLVPAALLPGSPGLVALAGNLSNFVSLAPLTVFMLFVLFFVAQPFLALAPAVAYFEPSRPVETLHHVRKYVRPHYPKLLLAFFSLLVLSWFVGTLTDLVTNIPLSQDSIREKAVTFVLVSAFGFLVQLLGILLVFTLNIVTQTLLYLHIGKPRPQNHFVSEHPVAKMLTSMVHTHPHHSPYLPVKWKQPGIESKSKKKSR